jgi:23S rRNA (guanosine2251-2'-O)-methyltransferase
MEALRSSTEIEEIFFLKTAQGLSELLYEAKKAKIRTKEATHQFLEELAPRQSHQGIVARLKHLEFTYASMEDVFERANTRGEKLLVAILDEIVDPHNLGAIVRSAECAGFHGIVIPKHNSADVNATAMKTSAGAVSHIPIVQVTNLARTLKELKEQGVWIYGTSMETEKSYDDFDVKDHIGIVIGSEGEGMRRLTKENCDFLIRIPMYGSIESLNASVAAGIIFFEVRRQRRGMLAK